jgi:hypothetical protein
MPKLLRIVKEGIFKKVFYLRLDRFTLAHGEMMITKVLTPIAALVVLVLSACNSSQDVSLSLPNAPKTLSVGQTLYTGPASEKMRDEEGRSTTNTDFTDYTLVSSDTTKVKVIGLSVFGVDTGAASIYAESGDVSGLISAKYSITVKSP